jgi:hypothetical protein
MEHIVPHGSVHHGIQHAGRGPGNGVGAEIDHKCREDKKLCSCLFFAHFAGFFHKNWQNPVQQRTFARF